MKELLKFFLLNLKPQKVVTKLKLTGIYFKKLFC